MANLSDTELKVLNKIKDLLTPNAVCIGFETLTVTTSSLPLANIPSTATSAVIQIESNITTDAIRYREDGIAPTSSVGKFKSNGDEFEIISIQSINQFKVIQGTGGTTKLNVFYYK